MADITYTSSNFRGSAKDDIREQELREIDQYDVMNPTLFEPYIARLEKASQFLDKHLPNVSDQTMHGEAAREVKRTLLDYSGLAGGQTNFWADPYSFSGIQPSQQKHLEFRKNYMDIPPFTEAMAYSFPTQPYNVNFNPAQIHKTQYSGARLLGHELGHTKESLYEIGVQQGKHLGNWRPNFSEAMWDDLANLSIKSGPYYKGHGMGRDAGETMSYLMGREAELRHGKTLLDDPTTRGVFQKYPGSYDEYVRARNALRQYEGRRR